MKVYATTGHRNRRVSEAFAKGGGLEVVPATGGLQDGGVVAYGWTRGLLEILREAWAQNREWFYVDNAYLGRNKYFRVTRGAMQWAGGGVLPRGSERFAAHGLEIEDWRKSGEHILIACQSLEWYGFIGAGTRDRWIQKVTQELAQHSKRPVVVRYKDEATPLEEHLDGCWAVVTHSSNVAVDAILKGIPAFVLGESAASSVALSDLSRIERPKHSTTRLRWACTLAANQWTLDEMRSGKCWADLMAVKQ